jgi:hypothetical protein
MNYSADDHRLRASLLELLNIGYRLEVFGEHIDIVRPDSSIAMRVSSDGTRPFEEVRAMVRALAATTPGVAIDWKTDPP